MERRRKKKMIYFNTRKLFLYSFLLLLSLSCKKHKENKVDPDSEYIRYVNTATIANDLVPLDIVSTSDGGFLILGSSPSPDFLYHKTYILKVDKEGNYSWDTYLDTQYLNPVSDIIVRNGDYYLFCMDQLTGTYLIKINQSTHAAEQVSYFSKVSLPLSASTTPDGGYLILNCNLGDNWTGFTKVAPDLSTTWSKQFGFDPIFGDEIDRHIKREIAPLPFFTGTVQDGNSTTAYYFNAYYQANFSCVFINPSTGKPTGFYLGGDRAYASMRTLLPLEGSIYAMTHYDRNNTNFLIPRDTLNIGATIPLPVSQLAGQSFADMKASSRVVCRRYTLAGRDVILYAANTKNNGVGLYAFDEGTGTYLGSENLSLETPFEMGGMVPTSDGGLVVLAKTYIDNRFPRVCLFKRSNESVKKLVGM
jgi:hypothetical protein